MSAIHWGIIGAGKIAVNQTIPGFLAAPNSEVLAVCRRDARELSDLASKLDVVGYVDYRELIADKRIDAVYIATPPSSHAEIAVAAALAGKHVLVEKPTSVSADEAQRIVDAGSQGRVFVMTALMMRYHPLHQRIRQLIESGVLGELRLLRLDFCIDYSDSSNWRADAALGGGGAFADLGPHLLDLLTWCTAEAPVLRSSLLTVPPGSLVDVAGTALLQLGNGAHAFVTARFDLPTEFSPSRFEVWGTKGSVVATGTFGQETLGRLEFSTANGVQAEEPAAVDLYAAQAEAFAQLVDKPSKWEKLALETLALQKLMDEVYSRGDLEE